MKKLFGCLVFGILLLVAISTVQGQSQEAKNMNGSESEDVVEPKKFNHDDGNMECCLCHWGSMYGDGGPPFPPFTE